MNISIYGAGYVGLVSAACFAKLGHQVICADINKERIEQLQKGHCPIYEEGLPELLEEQLSKKNLQFTADILSAIYFSEIHFIATGTPSREDGSADLSQVFSVAKAITQNTTKNCTLITKSTVPVGTGALLEQEVKCAHPLTIAVVSNPEFLREGCAVRDFLEADRIILGGDPQALEPLLSLYEPLSEKGVPIVCMSRQSAELAKYTANAMLACRISFINQISRIAEEVEANIDEVVEGIGYDPRIGPYFLQAGIGYGGSCFPKDNRALIHTAQQLNIKTPILNAIETINRQQKDWVYEKLNTYFNEDLNNITIAIWGLSFKPGTDDLREASSLIILDSLLKAGAQLRLYDPVAIPAAKEQLNTKSNITWCDTAKEALNECDALVIATEWPEFINFSLNDLKAILGEKPIFDGRNCFKIEAVKQAKLSYYASIGRPIIRT